MFLVPRTPTKPLQKQLFHLRWAVQEHSQFNGVSAWHRPNPFSANPVFPKETANISIRLQHRNPHLVHHLSTFSFQLLYPYICIIKCTIVLVFHKLSAKQSLTHFWTPKNLGLLLIVFLFLFFRVFSVLFKKDFKGIQVKTHCWPKLPVLPGNNF
jgi:hypothetical protein